METDHQTDRLLEALELIAAMTRQGAVYEGTQPQGANDRYSYTALVFKTPLSEGDDAR